MAAAIAACGDVAEAPAPDDPCDPMAPAFAGRDPSTPRKKARVRQCPVTLTMPAKCKEKHPSCDATRQVTCYVQHARQVWMSVEDVPWLVRFVRRGRWVGSPWSRKTAPQRPRYKALTRG